MRTSRARRAAPVPRSKRTTTTTTTAAAAAVDRLLDTDAVRRAPAAVGNWLRQMLLHGERASSAGSATRQGGER
jgi:hypothetical protein